MQWGVKNKEVTFQLSPTMYRFLLDEQGQKGWSEVRDKEEEKMEQSLKIIPMAGALGNAGGGDRVNLREFWRAGGRNAELCTCFMGPATWIS